MAACLDMQLASPASLGEALPGILHALNRENWPVNPSYGRPKVGEQQSISHHLQAGLPVCLEPSRAQSRELQLKRADTSPCSAPPGLPSTPLRACQANRRLASALRPLRWVPKRTSSRMGLCRCDWPLTSHRWHCRTLVSLMLRILLEPGHVWPHW